MHIAHIEILAAMLNCTLYYFRCNLIIIVVLANLNSNYNLLL